MTRRKKKSIAFKDSSSSSKNKGKSKKESSDDDDLSDIDDDCLKVAESNSKFHNLPATFLCGDLLEPFIKNNIKLDVLVCNPPYIGDKSTIDEQVWKYEPHKALLAEPKTAFYERIFTDADIQHVE